MFESLKMVGLCVVAAVGYGEIHDQITARICLQYFTEFHYNFIGTDDPTSQALFWGFAATWWVGVLLGVPLAMVARVGARPKLKAKDMLRPVGGLLAVMAVCALTIGVIGYTTRGRSVRDQLFAGDYETADNAPGFYADLYAHNASYDSGIIGGLILIGFTNRRRRLLAS